MQKEVLLQACFLILIGIVLGAFGAHYIKGLAKGDLDIMNTYDTGIKYQLYHGLALLVLAFQAHKFPFELKKITRLITIGVIFFSVSIYILVLIKVFELYNPPLILALCTPLGGVILVFSWSYFIYKIMRYL